MGQRTSQDQEVAQQSIINSKWMIAALKPVVIKKTTTTSPSQEVSLTKESRDT